MKRLLSLVLAVLLMFSVVACSKPAEKTDAAETAAEETVKAEETKEETPQDTEKEEANSAYPVTIKTYNVAGEEVELTFEKAPERTLAVYQSALENLLALGVSGDKIVATAQLDIDVKPEWKAEFDKIKYYDDSPGKEEVLGLNPDFIVSWSSYFGEKKLGDIKFWNDKGINTYIIQNSGIKKPNKVEYAYEDIMNLGKIFDKEEKAMELVENMKKDIEAGAKYVEGKEKVKTLILEVGKPDEFRIYGKDSIGGDVATQVGADLVIAENGKVGAEDIINANPDVIFTVYYGDDLDKEEALKSLFENEKLASVNAIANKRVHAMNLSEVYASGVRTADAIKTIVKGLYPDLVIE